MSFGAGSIMVTIGVNTTALTTATKQMQIFAATSTKAMASVTASMTAFGASMTRVGKSMTTSLSIPMALIGVGAMKMSADFEFSMAKIVGLVGVAEKQVDEWATAIKKLGPALGRSPKELADAMFFITSAGLRGAEAMEVLEMSTRASVAGMGEVKIIADVVTSAMNAYGSANLDAAKATDILTAAVREGKVEADTMAQSMGKVLPVASQMGVSFDQVAASTAAMTRTGTDATTAAIQLRQILNSLQKPSIEAEKGLELMKTSSAELRKTIREKGLLKALQDITELSKIYGETVFSKVFPNIRAMTGAFDLMGANAENNAEIFRKLTKVTGDLSRAYDAASQTLKVKWMRVVTNTQTAMIELGESIKTAIIPLFEALIVKIQALTKWWKGLSEATQQNILKWAGLVIVLGPVIAIVGTLISTFGSLLTGALALAGAIKVLTVVMWTNPILAFAAAMALVATRMYFVNQRTVEATASQKAYREEIEKTTALKGTLKDLMDMQNSLTSMNIRQVGQYIKALQEQKSAEEDAALSLITVSKAGTDALIEESDNMRSITMGDKLLKQGYIKSLIEGHKLQEASVNKNKIVNVKAINAIIQEAEKYLIELQKIKKAREDAASGGVVLNMDVEKVLLDVEKAEAFVIAKTKLLGDEFNSASFLLDAYKDALDGMISSHSPQATEHIKKYIAAIAHFKTISETTEPLTTLANKLQVINKLLEIHGEASFDAVTESLDAYTATLKTMITKGTASAEVIEMLTFGITKLKNKQTGMIAIQKQLNKELDDAAFFEGNFGNSIDLTQAKIQAQINALDAMRAAGKSSNEEIKKKVELIKGLQDSLTGLEIGNQLLQNLGNSITSLAINIGTALGSAAGATQSMTNIVIDSLLQLAGAMLSTTMAALLMSGAMTGGLAGLIVAGTLGLATLAALWEASDAKAKGMPTKMAAGGIVPPGYNNDTFPAMLSSNEAVIPLSRLNQIAPNSGGTDWKKVRFVIEGTELIGVIEAQNNVNDSF